MSVAFYPGCSLHGTGNDYAASAQAVSEHLGLGLEELEGWVCCGSTPAHNTSALLSASLSAKNLQLAAEQSRESVVVACAACFGRLRGASHELRHNETLRGQVEHVLEAPAPLDVRVDHLLELLVNGYGLEALAEQVRRPLAGLKVACYYGCLLVRPPEVMAFDDPERPTIMDRVLAACGAETVDWPGKTECCGANLSLSRSDIVVTLVDRLLDQAKRAGADVVAVACPLCQANLDVRQTDVTAQTGHRYDLPAVYFTQLVGLALGVDAARLGLDKSFVDSRPTLARWCS